MAVVGLKQRDGQVKVNDSGKEFVNGMTSTNSIESFCSLLKRGYQGHHMSKKHLQRYIDEFCLRKNLRINNTIQQLEIISKGMFDKKLTYKELIK